MKTQVFGIPIQDNDPSRREFTRTVANPNSGLQLKKYSIFFSLLTLKFGQKINKV